MKKHLGFVFGAMLLGFSGTAYADILASGPVYGGTSASSGTMNCRMFNAGTTVLFLTARQIFTNTNVSIALGGDTCGNAVNPNTYCAFTAASLGNLAYICKVTTSAAAPKLRGVAEFVTSGNVIINTLPITR